MIPSALTEGFQYAFAVGAGMAILGLVATLLLLDRRDRAPEVVAQEVATDGA